MQLKCNCSLIPGQIPVPLSQLLYYSKSVLLEISSNGLYQKEECATHIVVVKTSLSGFDVTDSCSSSRA